MVCRIIRKEILENLLSLRFVLALILIISLFAASGFIFVGKYKQQSREYWDRTNENLSALSRRLGRLNDLAFFEQQVFRRPRPLSLCAEGYEKSFPNCVTFGVFTVGLPQVKGPSSSALPHFSDVDWVFIISLTLSFLAFVFTFDSLCGEKESGTLRMMLANTIPRCNILLGKYFGAMITLCMPLFVGLIVSLIIVTTSGVVGFSRLEWLKILVVVIVSLLYLSIFLLMGILVSGRVTRSANGMVILLLLWVCLVLLVPSLGRTASGLFSQTVTRAELNRQLLETAQRIWENADTFGDNAGNSFPDANDPRMNLPARARLFNALSNARNQIIEDHHNKMMAQALAGRTFTSLSPTVVYQRAAEAIAGVGIGRCASFRRQVRRYQQGLREFIRSRDAEDPESRHLIFDEDNSRGAFDWRTISKRPVDFNAVPKFSEPDVGLGESVKTAVWDIGLLALFNVLLFAAAFVSFLRYDVR